MKTFRPSCCIAETIDYNDYIEEFEKFENVIIPAILRIQSEEPVGKRKDHTLKMNSNATIRRYDFQAKRYVPFYEQPGLVHPNEHFKILRNEQPIILAINPLEE
ncbi:unnamed protein product [Orchesella dallaii]|uniref:Uncharacterized protein n=1 Tax=Orchesella dallaii TaxID=48710 RepID=A0ABP1RQ97_9HEXA